MTPTSYNQPYRATLLARAVAKEVAISRKWAT